MAIKEIKDNGFAKILGVNPAVKFNANKPGVFYQTTVSVGGCDLNYKASLDTGTKLSFNVKTGAASWGVYEDMKSKLTSTPGITASLADNFGKLGKKAQAYLSSKGFGEISIGAGSVSCSSGKLTLEGFKINDVNKFNYAPYKDPYTTTQTVSLSKTIDLKKVATAAVAIIAVVSLIFLWEVYGAAALAEALAALGSAALGQLAALF